MRRLLAAVLLAALLLAALGCGSEPAATPPATSGQQPRGGSGAVRRLAESLEPLRADFERDRGKVRLIMLFAPT